MIGYSGVFIGGFMLAISLPVANGGEDTSELPLLQAISDNASDNIKAKVKVIFMISPSPRCCVLSKGC